MVSIDISIASIIVILFISNGTYGAYPCEDGIQMCYVSSEAGEEKAQCCYPGANACHTEISSKASLIYKNS